MSVTKRIGQIVTAIRVDGLAGARRAMSSMARGAGDVGKAIDKLDGKSAASVAAGADIASDSLREVAQAAKIAERAVQDIGDVKIDPNVSGFGKDLAAKMASEARIAGRETASIETGFADSLVGENRAAKDRIKSEAKARAQTLVDAEKSAAAAIAGLDASDRNAGARRAAQSVDVSGIDPAVAKRAVAAYKQALGRGVELDVYVDEEKSVRLVRDQLRALERRAGKLNIEAFDEAAVQRAAVAIKEAAAEGRSLAEYVDASTGTVFDAEQLAEVAKHAKKAERELADAGDEAKRLAKEEKAAAAEARRLELRALAVGTALGFVVGAAIKAGNGLRTMGNTGYAATRRLISGLNLTARGLTKATALSAKLTAGLTAAAAVKVGGAAAFAVKAGTDTIERYRQTRNVSSLTGMTPQEVELWERFGASVGLEGTDLGQVFSGFTAAVREAGEGGNDTAAIFDRLGVSVTGANKAVNKGISGLVPSIKSLWPSIEKGAETSTKSFRKTNTVFLDFLNRVNKLSKEERGQILTQVFGEDDALKVAEIADQVAASGGRISGALGRGLVSDQDIAQIKRYQAAVLSLGNAWGVFKRQLLVALEPMMTTLARFAEGRLVRSSATIIRDYFVRPLSSAMRSLMGFVRFMDGNDGWRRVNTAIQRTFAVAARLFATFGKLGALVYRTFSGGRNAEATYANVLKSITGALRAVDKWAADGRGEKALLALAEAGKGLWTVFEGLLSVVAAFGLAIDDYLRDKGIDLSAIFSIDNLRNAFTNAITWIGAFFSDIQRILSGQFGLLETDLAKRLVLFGASIVLTAIVVSDKLREIVASFFAEVREFIDGLVGYWKLAWAEMASAGNGSGLSGISTMLGKLLYILASVLDYVERLSQAFHDIFVLQKDAPEGFRWLQDVREIFGQLWTAIKNIHRAIQPIISAIDTVLEKIGGWNTATVILAGLIAGKLFGAIKTAIAAMGTLFGVSAGGAAAGAAGGATAGAAAGGGMLAAISTIGGRILALASGPFGVLLTAVGLVTAAVSTLSERFDALREKRMDLARLKMDRDYEKYGAKNGLSVAENDARRAALKSVNPSSYGSVYGAVNRQVVYTAEDDPATIRAKMLGQLPTQKIEIKAGDTVIEALQTESQAAALRRSRSLSLGN
ncbi:MAG: hypothetical protein ABJF67_17615 [Aurantimonas coralicida]